MGMSIGVVASATPTKAPLALSLPAFDPAIAPIEANELRLGTNATWEANRYRALRTVWFLDGERLDEFDYRLVPDTTNPLYAAFQANGGYLSKLQIPYDGSLVGKVVSLAVEASNGGGATLAVAPEHLTVVSLDAQPMTWRDFKLPSAGATPITPRNGGRSWEGRLSSPELRWVRTNRGRRTGKWYWEAMLHDGDAAALASAGLGLGYREALTQAGLGERSGSMRVGLPGALWTGTATAQAGKFPATWFNKNVRFALDLDTHATAALIWISVEGGPWNNDATADPAAGTGAIQLAGQHYTDAQGARMTFPIYPMMAASSGSGSQQAGGSGFFNDAEFAYAPPAGFAAFDGFAPSGSSIGQLANSEARLLAQAYHWTAPPALARLQLIDNTIAGLKSDGIWTRLNRLVVLAAHDQQAGALDWTGRAGQGRATAGNQAIETVSGLTFVVDRHQANNGVAAVGPTFGLGSSAGYAQNDAHMGLWSRTALASGTTNRHEWGSANGYISNAPSGVLVRANAAAADTFADVPFASHILWSRASASQAELYSDGEAKKTIARASAAPTTGAWQLHAVPGLTAAGNNELMVAHSGLSLTAAQAAALHTRLKAYLAAVGAVVDTSASNILLEDGSALLLEDGGLLLTE